MNDKTIETISHWTVTLGIVLLGSLVGATLIVVLGGMAIFALFGNVTVMFTDAQVQVLYGLLTLALVHLCTGGWWLRSCIKHVEEMNALHEHAIARMSPQTRKAFEAVQE